MSRPGSGIVNPFRLRPITLRFPAARELAYRAAQYRRRIAEVRVAIVCAVFFFSSFALFDFVIFPERFPQLALVRFASLPLVAVPLFALTFHRSFPIYGPLATAAVAVVTSGALTAMYVMTPVPSNYLYFAGVLVVIFFSYGLLHLPFLESIVAGTGALLVYVGAVVILVPKSAWIVAGNLFIVLSANVIGLLMNYTTSRALRRDYVSTHLLAMRTAQLDQARASLEQRVEERTSSLDAANRSLQEAIGEARKHEAALAARLRERDSMLHEIHHRVRNNLQVITSLIHLEASASEATGDDAMNRIAARVQSMAMVHNALYEAGDLGAIDVTQFFQNLDGDARAPDGRNRPNEPHGERSFTLELEQAVPAALLASEVEFLVNDGASITAQWNGQLRITLLLSRADSRSVPKKFHQQNTSVSIITALSEQIGGNVEVSRSSDGLTRVGIELPLSSTQCANEKEALQNSDGTP